jgi:hypothetical protein
MQGAPVPGTVEVMVSPLVSPRESRDPFNRPSGTKDILPAEALIKTKTYSPGSLYLVWESAVDAASVDAEQSRGLCDVAS